MALRSSNPNEVPENIVSAENLFTDREEPRKAFWDLYEKMQPGDIDIITYYGVGGIGKSTLLKKLGKEIEEKIHNGKLDYVYYSFESEPPKELFLYALSRQFMMRNKGLKFPLFDTAIAKIAGDGNSKELLYAKDKNSNFFSTEAADLLTTVAGDFLPFVSSTTKALAGIVDLGDKVISLWQKEKGPHCLDYKEISYKDSKSVKEKLHEYFRKDAYETFDSRKRPMVIFLDGYEHFVNRVKDGNKSELVDYWMFCENTGLIYLPNTIWVIAGRDKLNWPEDIIPSDQHHRIGDLSKVDAISFLEKAGICDSELINRLYNITNGTPAFLDLCVETYRNISTQRTPVINDFGNNVEKLATRYLENMDSNKQKIMEMISFLPNVWDTDMALEIAERLGYGNIRITLTEEMLPLSIFEKELEGHRLHETVRTVINKTAKDAEKIYKTIIVYYKEHILKDDVNLSRLRLIEQLCYYFRICSGKLKIGSEILNETELLDIRNILANDKEYYGEYWLCENVIQDIINFCKENNYSDEFIIGCMNLRNFNQYFLGNFREGYDLSKETYEYATKVLPEDNAERLNSLYNLASSYNDIGDNDTSRILYEECLKRRIEILGEKSLDVVRTMNNLAFRYEDLGKKNPDSEYMDKAFELRNKCYQIRLELSGANDINTLKCLNNLAYANYIRGDKEQAYELRKKCYYARAELLGEYHLDTLNSMDAYAESELDKGNTKLALELYEKCISIKSEMFGPTNPKTIQVMPRYIRTLSAAGQKEKAINLAKEYIGISENFLGNNHVFTKKLVDALALCEKA